MIFISDKIFTAYDYLQGLLESGTHSSDRNQSERNRSVFADFGKKCKRLIPFLWPKKSFMLQLRVLVCFFILILGRVINVFVPQYNKYIGNYICMKYLIMLNFSAIKKILFFVILFV